MDTSDRETADTVQRLVARLQGGDAGPTTRRLTGELLVRLEPLIRAEVRRQGRSLPPQATDELVQDVIETILRKLAEFRGGRPQLRKWTRQIAWKKTANARRRRRDAFIEDEVLEPTDPGHDALARMLSAERADFLTEAIRASAKGRDQELLYHRYVALHDRETVARLLGLEGGEDQVRKMLQNYTRRFGKEIQNRLAELGHGESFLVPPDDE